VFITVASNIAVMAPSTHIGAATPISLDGSGEKPRSRRTRSTETTGTQAVDGESTQPGTIRIVIRDDGKEEGGTESSAAAKMLNDTAAWAEATARTRGRNPQWTRDTVLEARSSTAEEALRLGVIDFIATSTADLYRLIDGRTVQTAKDPVVLRTANVPVMEPVTMSGQEQFLNFLADPTIAYLLISLGTLCIFIEFYNPGLIVPGLIGLISFLLAAVALNILPINIMAVVLIVVGVGLILLELKFPLFFVPTIGGIIFLIVGALLLIDEPRVLPGGYVPLGLAIGIGSGTGGILALLTGLTIRAHSRRVLTGMSSYEGETAEVVEDLNPRGTVFFGGTYWSATLVDETGQPAVGRTVAKGGLVRVKKVQHLRVEVQALEEEKPEKGAGQG
jgi:membrane-bound serine protease (ClpP class)